MSIDKILFNESQKEFSFAPKSIYTYLKELGYGEDSKFTMDESCNLINSYFMDQAINIDKYKIVERVQDYYSLVHKPLGIKLINFTSMEPLILHIERKYKNPKLEYIRRIWMTRS